MNNDNKPTAPPIDVTPVVNPSPVEGAEKTLAQDPLEGQENNFNGTVNIPTYVDGTNT